MSGCAEFCNFVYMLVCLPAVVGEWVSACALTFFSFSFSFFFFFIIIIIFFLMLVNSLLTVVFCF